MTTANPEKNAKQNYKSGLSQSENVHYLATLTDLDQEGAEEYDVAPVPLGVVVLEDGADADAAPLPPHFFRQFVRMSLVDLGEDLPGDPGGNCVRIGLSGKLGANSIG